MTENATITIEKQINKIQDEAQQMIAVVGNLPDLEQVRTRFFGKKGELTEVLKQLGGLPAEARSQAGQVVNVAKQQLLEQLNQRVAYFQDQELNKRLQEEAIDVTLPGRAHLTMGSRHPITRIMERIVQLFTSIGFVVVDGPEVEDDYHNFAALNFPTHHPARAMHDTFYFDDGRLLRTHTSPVQIRALEQMSPPLRVITPGRVYRCDSDQTHTPMFHQLEGLLVDEHCTMAHLKGMLQDFFNQLFEKGAQLPVSSFLFPVYRTFGRSRYCLCAV